MAGIRISLGKYRRNRAALGLGGLLALAGCHSAEKEDNFGNLDIRTRQMLLAPTGGNLKAPAQQYAVTDPAATGATGITPGNAFNRGMPNQGQPMAKGDPNTTGYVPVNMQNTTGVVQAGVTAPTIPNNPATMQLQPQVRQAVATAPAAPASPVVAQAPVPNTPPVAPLALETPAIASPITIVNSALTAPEITPPPAPSISSVAPPALPSATPPGLTTLPSPVDQPPVSLGPVPPGPLK